MTPPSTSLQDERLRRLEEALAEGQAREAAAVEAWVRRTGRLPSKKVRRKWEKQWSHEAKRDAHRASRARRRSRRSRDPARAAVYFVMAATFLVMAMGQPRRMWWLGFIALGFFLAGLKHARRPEAPDGASASREGDAVGPAPVVAPSIPDPRTAKVDALCARLLAELGQGPSVLREVVHAPERTVEALRKSCHELARRERELRELAKPEAGRELEDERAALARRVEAERDAVVRERLEAALVALDEQRRQRAELGTAADRLEAEFTRLYYTLEGLHTQVLRVRTADAAGEDVAGLGLRQSVAQLGAEVDAVADALEEVHRPPVDGRQRTR
ncbi:hypothetical protein LY474_14855 [Myxococcus stipitatus]|uniref:hypothetical protein n=1 Tax=Myxococcus stipitatus TaxID=83455 RepID=UPI001F174C70|nr:hypothetical protein [Myxococcus stipitatus]MCE9669090.1 hypothetical protein [Myxococcus stipitatus]